MKAEIGLGTPSLPQTESVCAYVGGWWSGLLPMARVIRMMLITLIMMMVMIVLLLLLLLTMIAMVMTQAARKTEGSMRGWMVESRISLSFASLHHHRALRHCHSHSVDDCLGGHTNWYGGNASLSSQAQPVIDHLCSSSSLPSGEKKT